MNQRTKEDEAAWRAWTDGVRAGDQAMVLMRRIIDAVDAVRLRVTGDRDETSAPYRYGAGDASD